MLFAGISLANDLEVGNGSALDVPSCPSLSSLGEDDVFQDERAFGRDRPDVSDKHNTRRLLQGDLEDGTGEPFRHDGGGGERRLRLLLSGCCFSDGKCCSDGVPVRGLNGLQLDGRVVCGVVGVLEKEVCPMSHELLS